MGVTPAKLYVADLGERAVVRITGRANCLSSVSFKRVINSLIERGRRVFTLDLSDCQLMDSTFLGVLVGLNRTLGQAGPDGGFSLYKPTESVRVLLDNLGILELFSTAESLGQAVEILQRIFTTGWTDPRMPLLLLLLVVSVWIYQFVYESSLRSWLEKPPVKVGLAAVMILWMLLFAPGGGEPFIYFQF